MGVQFADYVEPTNTGPNVLARWDEVRGGEADQVELFVNQVAAELQALSVLQYRTQRKLVARDSTIQQLEGEKLLPSYGAEAEMSRWEHFKAAFLP